MVKKFALLGLMISFFSIAAVYAQSNQASCSYNRNACYVPADDYKHQFSKINTGRGGVKVEENETLVNHNYKQQAGGNIEDARGVFNRNGQSGRIPDENIQRVVINHNYKQQAGSPIPDPGRAVVISEEVDRGC